MVWKAGRLSIHNSEYAEQLVSKVGLELVGQLKITKNNKLFSVSDGDAPFAREEVSTQGWNGRNNEPEERLGLSGAEQGPLLVHQDHVVNVQPEKSCLSQSSF